MAEELDGRARVLREARGLFLELGFAEVSMQQIADAAGMTKASLYYHFRNKEALFAEVAVVEILRLVDGIKQEINSASSFEDGLVRVASFVFRAARSDFGRLVTDFRRHVSEEDHIELRRGMEGLDPLELMRPLFEKARAKGEIRDVDIDVAIISFFGLIGGTLKFCMENSVEMDLGPESAATLVDIFANGVGARPGAESELAAATTLGGRSNR
jgi:AcrR family transcriptional regulator